MFHLKQDLVRGYSGPIAGAILAPPSLAVNRYNSEVVCDNDRYTLAQSAKSGAHYTLEGVPDFEGQGQRSNFANCRFLPFPN